MLSIPFFKPNIGEGEINEVLDCLRGGWLTTGPRVKQFEAEFSRYIQHTHAVALNSCTAALHLGLEVIGVRPGQRVIVPTMTFAATAEVVHYCRAKPLLVDCRPEDLNLDVADASRKIEAALARGEEVGALISVDYGGQVGDIAGITALAQRYKLPLIEDAAHCCPAYYRTDANAPWKTVGSDAQICCFSFYANKTITTGEGGMACTESAEDAQRMRMLSLHGISKDAWKRYTAEGSWYYEILMPGYKYNLTDIAAAIGLHQLRKADDLHLRRTRLAELYLERLAEVDELILPKVLPNRIHSWHLFWVRLLLDGLDLDRGEVINQLKQAGIGTSVHWMPLHLHPYYQIDMRYAQGDCPCATSIYPELVTLPLYPDMTEDQVEYVCQTLKEIIAHARVSVAGAAA